MKRFHGFLLWSVVVMAMSITIAPGARAEKGGSKPPSPPEERIATQLEVGAPVTAPWLRMYCSPVVCGTGPMDVYTATGMTARLITTSGSPVASRTVDLSAGNGAFCRAVTDASGRGSCAVSVSGVAVPATTARGTFAGDSTYGPSEGSFPVSS